METRSNNVLVGAVTLALILAVALFTVWLANHRGGDRNEYDIFFKQAVDGLNKGAMVQFSGVPAGQVKEIALWPEDPELVRVRIEVDAKVPVLEGTTATLQGVGFTGVTQVALDGAIKGAKPIVAPGPAGRPVIPTRLGGLGELLNSAPLLLERLTTLTERLSALADDRNQRSVAAILDNVETSTAALARNGPALEAALADTRVALARAGEAASAVGKLADATTGTMERSVDPAMADLRTALAAANKSMTTLNAAVEDARPGLQTFSQSTIPEANSLIRDLRKTSANLNALTDKVERQGAGALIGSGKLPDYKP